MDELNAAPSGTEPNSFSDITGHPGPIPTEVSVAEAGTADLGESHGSSPISPSSQPSSSEPQSAGQESPQSGFSSGSEGDTSVADDVREVGGGVDAPSHLLLLDAMLAEIERKIAAGIHLFAHEVTAARDHLAKLL
ncbi:hypothetical protein LGN09_23995 [Burkholderia cenocepacia]|uniref:hypothetical protein n=1 Tax=Burkholderia cenocepacia TaxID=95486 RepID=UPI001CF51A81|nr:hypothetical protein [Burkholderia cenocepacia]MCA8407973.1 hypothetical protein [Burkholderia cenocepacia]